VRPFGADDRDFKKAGGNRLPSSLTPGLPVVGWVGRMFAGKGLHVLLRASKLMRRPHQLLVVGDGPRRRQEHALAEELGISDRVHWAGSVAAAGIPACYAAMDVYTHPAVSRPPDMPAWKEQFARTLVEAMLAGKPVVSTASGEIPWVLGGGGLIVPEKNPQALAKALDRVLASKRLRARLGGLGRARALAHFTWSRAAEELVNIWKKLLSKVSSSR